jgi:hypothetical protein
MTFADTNQFVTYFPPNSRDRNGNLIRLPRTDHGTGTVDTRAYLNWLRNNGYELGNLGVQ